MMESRWEMCFRDRARARFNMTADHSKKTVVEIEDEVRLTAELIFDFLYREGEMDLEQLREKVTHQVPFFDWGIGWLIGKGDIEIAPQGTSFSVRRKGPTPVVIPLRGN
jgi:hypothetical protein